MTDIAALEKRVGQLVDRLLSREQDEEWITLRESIGDKLLSDLEEPTYLFHMRLIAAQNLAGAATRECGGMAAIISDPVNAFERIRRANKPIEDRIERQSEESKTYNNAYGATPDNAANMMLGAFGEMVGSGDTFGPRVRNALEPYLAAQWISFKEELTR